MNQWDDPRIQRGMQAQLKVRGERLAAGDRPVGWKVGFGAPAMLEKFRINAPLVGSLLDGGLVPSGGTVALAGWKNPIIEPEIAVYMGKDLAAGADAATAAAAVAAIGPIFELVDLHTPPEDPEAILAGNIYHRHVVQGPRDSSRAGLRLDGLVGRISKRGQEVARTADPTANTGNLLDIVRHVATLLAAFGERLRAGEMIITGSIVAPLPIKAEDESLEYALDPVGSVSVRLRN